MSVKTINSCLLLVLLAFPFYVHAGTTDLAQPCTQDADCVSGKCAQSTLTGAQTKFCACASDQTCEAKFTKQTGETWTCKPGEDKTKGVPYCSSNTRGNQDPIAAGAAPSGAPEEKTPEKAGEKVKLIAPTIEIPIPELPSFASIEVKPGEEINVPYIAQYIIAIYKYGLTIGSILAVMMIVAGGIMYIISSADPSKINTAKQLIFGSITGITVLICSYLLLKVINPNLVDLKAISLETIPMEFLDESTAGIVTDPGSLAAAAVAETASAIYLAPGQFGSLNKAGGCTPTEIITAAKTLASLKVCFGACHCASTVSRILRLAGCSIPSSGSANDLKKRLLGAGWILKNCTDFPLNTIPVGYLYTSGHAMVSIGGGRLVESSTDIVKCWKSSEAVQKCMKDKKTFDECAIAAGECPKSTMLSVNKPYCDYCAKIPDEGPATCRFSAAKHPVTGEFCRGSESCASNQCTYQSGPSRIKWLISKNSCEILYKAGWEDSGKVVHNGPLNETATSAGSSGH